MSGDELHRASVRLLHVAAAVDRAAVGPLGGPVRTLAAMLGTAARGSGSAAFDGIWSDVAAAVLGAADDAPMDSGPWFGRDDVL